VGQHGGRDYIPRAYPDRKVGFRLQRRKRRRVDDYDFGLDRVYFAVRGDSQRQNTDSDDNIVDFGTLPLFLAFYPIILGYVIRLAAILLAEIVMLTEAQG
jgi:hypothetical protein